MSSSSAGGRASGLSLGAYLRDDAAALGVEAMTVAVAALMMCAFGVEASLIWAVCLVFIASMAMVTVIKFLKKRAFLDRLGQTVQGLSDQGCAWLAPELMEEPRGLEERLVLDALREGSRSMANQVADLRAEQREYRDYVETWVHEIKTPIAAARLVAANSMTPATEAMDVELRHIEDYVDQSLYYARSTSVERDLLIRQVELGTCVKAALKHASRTLIDAGVAPELGNLNYTVRADAKWLEFVLRQVLVNAAKYRKPNDGLEGQAAVVKIWAERRQTGLDAWETVLHVQDNGVGICAADLPRIFDRGFTGQNGRAFGRSTGIGLYLVRNLCKKMGLGVAATSVEGEWTRVSITFPDSFAG